MKITQILKENDANAAVQQFLEQLVTNCSDAVEFYKNTTRCLYRGSNRDPFKVVDPTKKYHPASYSDFNIHYDLMDNLPSWNRIPNRCYSVDITTAYDTAREYGAVFMAFPANGSNLACTPGKRDFWFSFSAHEGENVNWWGRDLVDRISAALDDIAMNSTHPEYQVWLEWDKYLRATRPHSRRSMSGPYPNFKQLIDSIERVTGFKIWKGAAEYLDPSNVMVTTTSQLNTLPFGHPTEVWCDGPVYMLNNDFRYKLDELINK